MKYLTTYPSNAPTRSTARTTANTGNFRTVGRHGDQWRNHDSHGRTPLPTPPNPWLGRWPNSALTKGDSTVSVGHHCAYFNTYARSDTMKASTIPDQKGHSVVTVPPDATVDVLPMCWRRLSHRCRRGVGPTGTRSTGLSPSGMLYGPSPRWRRYVDARIDAIMTPAVGLDAADSTDDPMLTMTERRIRHVPVVAMRSSTESCPSATWCG